MICQRRHGLGRQLAVEPGSGRLLGKVRKLTPAGDDLDATVRQLGAGEIQQVLCFRPAPLSGDNRGARRPEHNQRSHEQRGHHADLDTERDAEFSGSEWHFLTLLRSRDP